MDAPASSAAVRRIIAPLRRGLVDALGGTPSCLVVAVSGGPDSLCLLHALKRVAGPLSLRLHAAHLDHGLRGSSGEDDAAFVQRTCEAWGIPLTCERISVAGYQREHPEVTSLEAAARAVRYGFLRDVAAATGAVAVVTGHTRDDQAETVLLHLVRGAGLPGLRGMAPDTVLPTNHGPLRVLRPLLGVPRNATHAYCAAAGLAPRQDETNQTAAFTRNRLRQYALPPLQAINPRVNDALARLAAQAQLDHDYWEAEIRRLLPSFTTPFPAGLLLARADLRELPSALSQRVLLAAAHIVAPGAEVSYDHMQALHLLTTGAAGKRLWLPEAPLFALATYDDLVLTQRPLDLGAPAAPLPVSDVGAHPWGHWLVRLCPPPAGLPPAEAWSVTVDAGGLLVRHRQPGDRFGRGKLQDALVDAHCPELLRDHLPVVTDAEGAVRWVAGLGGPPSPPSRLPAGKMLTAWPNTEALRTVLRLWKGRSYNDEVH